MLSANPGRNPAVIKPIKTANYYVGCPVEQMDALCNGKGGARAYVADPKLSLEASPTFTPILGLFRVYFG